jgi:hypothetical protein
MNRGSLLRRACAAPLRIRIVDSFASPRDGSQLDSPAVPSHIIRVDAVPCVDGALMVRVVVDVLSDSGRVWGVS